MVDAHGKWQQVDQVLRLIEGNMDATNDELIASWPYLIAQAEPLYNASDDQWSGLAAR